MYIGKRSLLRTHEPKPTDGIMNGILCCHYINKLCFYKGRHACHLHVAVRGCVLWIFCTAILFVAAGYSKLRAADRSRFWLSF